MENVSERGMGGSWGCRVEGWRADWDVGLAGWRVDLDVGSFSGVKWSVCDTPERDDEAALGAFESLGRVGSVREASVRRLWSEVGSVQGLRACCQELCL